MIFKDEIQNYKDYIN